MSLILLVPALLVAIVFSDAKAFPPIWPLPSAYTSGDKVAAISPKVTMNSVCQKSPAVDEAFDRMKSRVFYHHISDNGPNPIESIDICVKNLDVPFQMGVDESYELNVDENRAKLTCETVFGCFHGLETLSQLITYCYTDNYFKIPYVPWIVRDVPRFPHRGILVDSSRHFIPVKVLKHVIDGMSYTKLNVLHWHLVDDQAFPFPSKSHPKLAEKGAFSEEERYSISDIKDIVDYAKARGIRVEPELDTPGHVAAMCKGEPEVCPVPKCQTYGILDISKNYTYDVINDLLTEMNDFFPEKLIHMGGDEVDMDCWKNSPDIMKWLKEHNLDLNGGFEYYLKQVFGMANKLGHKVVGWQELWQHFGTKLDKSTIIQQWIRGSTTLPMNVTSNGYNLIYSDSSQWYLDWLDVTWKKMYETEPCKGLPEVNCKLILGGEGCMWAETIDTSDILQTIFPRAAAIAERLWSPRDKAVISEDAHDRIKAFRCLLNQRNIPAAPVDNKNARQAPPGPGSCYNQ